MRIFCIIYWILWNGQGRTRMKVSTMESSNCSSHSTNSSCYTWPPAALHANIPPRILCSLHFRIVLAPVAPLAKTSSLCSTALVRTLSFFLDVTSCVLYANIFVMKDMYELNHIFLFFFSVDCRGKRVADVDFEAAVLVVHIASPNTERFLLYERSPRLGGRCHPRTLESP